jgi:hypothetical protein
MNINNANTKYILNGIGSGDKYWCCEVCGKDVHRMFFQIELLKRSNGKWTMNTSNCRNLLGHEECLMRMQHSK